MVESIPGTNAIVSIAHVPDATFEIYQVNDDNTCKAVYSHGTIQGSYPLFLLIKSW